MRDLLYPERIDPTRSGEQGCQQPGKSYRYRMYLHKTDLQILQQSMVGSYILLTDPGSVQLCTASPVLVDIRARDPPRKTDMVVRC
jgi:hypothetical protein